jgi:hypothetical protein
MDDRQTHLWCEWMMKQARPAFVLTEQAEAAMIEAKPTTELITIETERDSRLVHDLLLARHEVAVLRVQLAASWEREKAMDATIRELRRELLEAHDVAGRAEGAAEVEAQELIQRHWTCAPDTDRRMMGR